MSFKSWLLTSSLEDAYFFTNIRRSARMIHAWRGHRWVEHMASCSSGVIKFCEVKIRTCKDCDRKEIMGQDGKWIERSEVAKELWMDDIGSIAHEATELIQKRLKEYNIELKGMEEDEFFVPITEALEKYSNGNYRHEH